MNPQSFNIPIKHILLILNKLVDMFSGGINGGYLKHMIKKIMWMGSYFLHLIIVLKKMLTK